jgi:hypothetical protein
MIERDGQPFALLISYDGRPQYLVPPLVFDRDLNLMEGHDVLAGMRVAGVTIETTDGGIWRGRTSNGGEVAFPYLVVDGPGDLAGIDQVMSSISEQLGVPVGPPDAPR